MANVISIIIPAYNEDKTIKQLLQKVADLNFPDGATKEIVVINDHSKDNTESEIKSFIKESEEKVLHLFNEKNLGKSQTVKKGMLSSNGNYVVIQDADLEYDPNDILHLYNVMQDGNYDFVYGNRFGKKNKKGYKSFYLANKFLSFMSNIFVWIRRRQTIPDMEVCYKLIRGDIAREIASKLISKSKFGLEPEITARLTRYRNSEGKLLKFTSVPVSYHPRTMEEGKHIKASDGVKAVFEIIRFNISKL